MLRYVTLCDAGLYLFTILAFRYAALTYLLLLYLTYHVTCLTLLSKDRRDFRSKVYQPSGAGEVHANPHQGLLRKTLEAHHQHSPQVRRSIARYGTLRYHMAAKGTVAFRCLRPVSISPVLLLVGPLYSFY